jgi:hypothetical protein
MPVMECSHNGLPGWKYGESGYCYTYKPGSEEGSNKAKQKAVLQGIAMGEGKLQDAYIQEKYTNDAPIGGMPNYEDDEIIEVPTVLAKEGVFKGVDGEPRLKTFDALSKSAPWFMGTPITSGHVQGLVVSPEDRKIGQILNVRARPEKRDIFGTARFFKSALTKDELKKIKAGQPFDGSIGYFTKIKQEPGKFADTDYTSIEEGPYTITEYAALFDKAGACTPKDGCGFYQNESINDDVPAEVAELEGNNMAENKPATEPEEIKKLLNEAIKPLNEAIGLMGKRLETLESTYKQLNSAAEEIKKFTAERATELETRRKESYRKLLNAANQIPEIFDKLYPEMTKDLASWQLANPDKLMNAVPDTKLKGKLLNADGTAFDLKVEEAKIWGY